MSENMKTGLFKNAYKSIITTSNKNPVKVLDIGIAIGRISDVILKYDVSLYCTDISETMIRLCENKYKGNSKVKKFKIHDVRTPLPNTWGKFDIVTAYRVLSYNPVSQLHNQLININKSMNKGGLLIFTFSNKYSSTLLPKIIYRKYRLGYDTSYNEIKKIVKNAGFSECYITGFSRLIDTLYDRCNDKRSADILFGIEKLLGAILGPTLFARLFYITCKK